MTRIDTRSFRKGLRALEREVELALAAQSGCCGVTPAQCHLILAVEEAGTASVGEVADALELDASTLSRAVDGLVKAGLLEREEDPENRRRLLVRLSPKGRAKAEAINGACDEYYEGLLASLTARDAESVTRALPIFAGAMREWRKSRPSECCREKSRGGSR